MNSEKNKDVFESMKVSKAVATLALPTIISMLVIVVYNMADTFFVGQTGDPNQVAAVSLTMPLFLIFMGIGNIFGIGGSSYISRSLGAGASDRVKNISSFCFYTSIGFSIVCASGFLLGMDNILNMIGTSDNTRGFANSYLTYICMGAPFIVVSTTLSGIVRGEGASKVAMTGVMVGTILNIVLDPVFILVLGMGVEGAAIATVIGNIASTVYFMYYIVRGKTILSLKLKYYKISNGIMQGVLSIGLPASIGNILMSMANIVLNNFLVSYGDNAVAGMGVAMKANMIGIMICIGLANGIQPLLGYNYGSKNYARMREATKYAIKCSATIGSVMFVVNMVFASTIVKAFINDPEVIVYGTRMLRALSLTLPIVGIFFIYMVTLQAMGKPKESLILILSRQGLVFVPMLFVLNRTFGLNGIIYAQPISDIMSVIISWTMVRNINKNLDKEVGDSLNN